MKEHTKRATDIPLTTKIGESIGYVRNKREGTEPAGEQRKETERAGEQRKAKCKINTSSSSSPTILLR
jgi:hypothetical protein